jgi:hypothetical protein
MVTMPELWRDYTPQSFEIREGRWFNALVRRDSPLAALAAAFSKSGGSESWPGEPAQIRN